jgi:tRNA modification GTPase
VSDTAATRSPAITTATLGDGRTIAALATTPGRGALAIIRLSGAEARDIAAALLDPAPTRARHATRCTVRDAQGRVIDDAIATLYVAPHTFTGEDLVEISTHGGVVVPTTVLAAAIAAGARQAEPGEFTRRAVLNGKLDLLQAEAIADLVDARSSASQQVALRQLDGGLSTRIGTLRQQILRLEALLAYDIDFPDEDDGPIPRTRIEHSTHALLESLAALLATGAQGALIHEGALVVLAGAPNAGKSSLFNALLGEARAIVTAVPGTTRDAIEAVLDLPGYPLRLVDTAGLRDTTDVVERLGIETSTRYLGRAAIVLLCADSATSLAAGLHAARAASDAEIVTVATKIDLVAQSKEFVTEVRVSAHTGEGLQALLALVAVRLANRHGAPALDAPALTSARQRSAVAAAARELAAFDMAWRDDALPPSIAAIHVRAAADALGELIGVVQVDDVLDVLFASFCVGK